MDFELIPHFEPGGDQPRAIQKLAGGLRARKEKQTLLGVTGSGKTFTMAHVMAHAQRPALVLSHNKTLAAQLYQEFKEFFPKNAVHYFVSYYDYYQPEAYIPATDTYIEKDAKINDFIDQLRHASTAAALTRRDLIIIASVSAIYGIGDPETYKGLGITIKRGMRKTQKEFQNDLARTQYVRQEIEKKPGTWSKKGDVLEIIKPTGEEYIRVEFYGNKIDKVWVKSAGLDTNYTETDELLLFPAKHFATPETRIARALKNIGSELAHRLDELKKQKKHLEADRLLKRTRYDINMMKETGYVNGIENYSRHIDGRAPGTPPKTLLDYMPKDFVTFIDESHITIPQIRGMYHGDAARKAMLIEHGFRLPSALDNRPLKFREFEHKIGQVIYVSATPSRYETDAGNITEQLVRPTGLLDPTIEIRPQEGEIRDVIAEIKKNVARSERALVIALTKRMAEDIAEHLKKNGIKTTWLHSEIKTLERPDILRKLRTGDFEALVGINLLREGLDLPEVSLICILDADKEGFLRNATTLIQTAGRASRHPQGRVIFYADTVTNSMKTAISETKRRRAYQARFNKDRGIMPRPIQKAIRAPLFERGKKISKEKLIQELKQKRSLQELKKEIEEEMLTEASSLNFERAAELRDILKEL